MTWDPAQYHRFREQRKQPWRDLVAMVEARPGMRIADLGCGSGELTAELHEQLGAAATVGVDSSEEMLARATEHEGEGVTFARADIGTLSREEPGPLGGPVDLIVANAALQWIADHPSLLARLRGLLAPGGQLAVQVPANHDHPSHIVADEIAGEAPFAAALGGYRRGVPVLPPRAYAEIVHRLGVAAQSVVLCVYPHEMTGPNDVVEWVKGSVLTAFRARLGDDALYEEFVARYRERLADRLEHVRPYLYTYNRIFVWARVAAP